MRCNIYTLQKLIKLFVLNSIDEESNWKIVFSHFECMDLSNVTKNIVTFTVTTLRSAMLCHTSEIQLCCSLFPQDCVTLSVCNWHW